jgi:hypothetical protein
MAWCSSGASPRRQHTPVSPGRRRAVAPSMALESSVNTGTGCGGIQIVSATSCLLVSGIADSDFRNFRMSTEGRHTTASHSGQASARAAQPVTYDRPISSQERIELGRLGLGVTGFITVEDWRAGTGFLPSSCLETGRLQHQGGPVSRHVETSGGSAIGSACYRFDCVDNIGYRDRRHNLYGRGCPQKRLYGFQIRQDSLLLVSTLCRSGWLTVSRCAGA